jgi:hypothetical protein
MWRSSDPSKGDKTKAPKYPVGMSRQVGNAPSLIHIPVVGAVPLKNSGNYDLQIRKTLGSRQARHIGINIRSRTNLSTDSGE